MMDVYLFDWGDTLMVDYPGSTGKMCNWPKVEAVPGAEKVLKHLSRKVRIYVATGASDSKEEDIKKAFARVGLSQYISGYFCKANIGFEKGTLEYLSAVLEKLGVHSSRVAMVGDSLVKDIKPAASIGIKPIWLTKKPSSTAPERTLIIGALNELCI